MRINQSRQPLERFLIKAKPWLQVWLPQYRHQHWQSAMCEHQNGIVVTSILLLSYNCNFKINSSMFMVLEFPKIISDNLFKLASKLHIWRTVICCISRYLCSIYQACLQEQSETDHHPTHTQYVVQFTLLHHGQLISQPTSGNTAFPALGALTNNTSYMYIVILRNIIIHIM